MELTPFSNLVDEKVLIFLRQRYVGKTYTDGNYSFLIMGFTNSFIIYPAQNKFDCLSILIEATGGSTGVVNLKNKLKRELKTYFGVLGYIQFSYDVQAFHSISQKKVGYDYCLWTIGVLKDWCRDAGHDMKLEVLSPYHLRLSRHMPKGLARCDIHPLHQKWVNLNKKTQGIYVDITQFVQRFFDLYP
jgi:hypothetical protein